MRSPGDCGCRGAVHHQDHGLCSRGDWAQEPADSLAGLEDPLALPTDADVVVGPESLGEVEWPAADESDEPADFVSPVVLPESLPPELSDWLVPPDVLEAFDPELRESLR